MSGIQARSEDEAERLNAATAFSGAGLVCTFGPVLCFGRHGYRATP